MGSNNQNLNGTRRQSNWFSCNELAGLSRLGKGKNQMIRLTEPVETRADQGSHIRKLDTNQENLSWYGLSATTP